MSDKNLVRAESSIAEWAAAYPEVVEERPWGHRAFKVRGKTFMFLTLEGDCLSFSLKLPQSGLEVLGLPFAEPTGYGLGKSGWVSCSFEPKDSVPLELIAEWLRESFVAIAPKKVSQALSTAAVSTATTQRSKTTRPAAAKATSKAKTSKKKPASKAKTAAKRVRG
jgi:predicted DNA-binding protein (MmcQ/YjbR family)